MLRIRLPFCEMKDLVLFVLPLLMLFTLTQEGQAARRTWTSSKGETVEVRLCQSH